MAELLELSEVVQKLREDLTLASEHSEEKSIQFNVDNIEIELQTVIEKGANAEVGGKIKFWVLDMDTKVGGFFKKQATHKIKLSLTPTKKDSLTGEKKDLQISDEE